MSIMLYDEEKIKIWVNNIINAISQIADLEFQKKAWVEGRSYLSISLDETACQLYDDSAFRNFLKESAKGSWLPETLLDKLRKFNIDFERYMDDHGTHYLVQMEMQTDPEWHKIQCLAQEVLEDFKALGISSS